MKNKGFTLIELIIVMAILGVVTAAIGSLLLSSVKVYNTSTDYANVQNNSVIISRLISNEISNSVAVYIYDEKPDISLLPEKIDGYIYQNLDDNIIYIKKGNNDEKPLLNPNGTSQIVNFSKADDNNVTVSLTITDDTSYNNISNVNLLNASIVDDTSLTTATNSGKFIAFAYKLDDPFITSFNLLSDNNDLSESAYGIILDNKIYIYINELEVGSYKPTIEIKGDKIHLGTVSFPVYDINNPTNIDFSDSIDNPVKMTVTQGNKSKEYEITVYGIDKVQFTFAKNLEIIATTKGTAPTVDSTSNRVMPNTSDTLNAIFEFEEELKEGYSYVVTWYGVPPEKISSYNNLLDSYLNQESYGVESVEISNSNTICLLDNPEYNEKLAGKYVYFDVRVVHYLGEEGDIVTSISEITNIPNYWAYKYVGGKYIYPKQRYVFTGLKNGTIFNTILNEIDYYHGDSFKRNTINLAYNWLTNELRTSYSGVSGNNSQLNNSSRNLISYLRIELPGKHRSNTSLTPSPFYSYDIDFVNRELTVTGASYQISTQNGNGPNQFYQFGLFAVNMYDSFFADRRVELTDTVRVGIKNEVDKNNIPLVGGVAVATTINSGSVANYSGYGLTPGVEQNDNNIGWDSYFTTIVSQRPIEYWDGYHANLIFSKSKYHESGVNYISQNYSRSSGNYDNPLLIDIVLATANSGAYASGFYSAHKYATVGAKNPLHPYVPYTFDDIKKDGFTIDPNGANDIYMDITYTRNSTSNRYFTVDLRDRENPNLSTYPMHFGTYLNSSKQSIYEYGDNNEHKVYTAGSYTFKDNDPVYPYSDVLKMFGVNNLIELALKINYIYPKEYTNDSDEIVAFRANDGFERKFSTLIGSWSYGLDDSKKATTKVTFTELTGNINYWK